MLEIHVMLRDAAKAFALAGGFINTAISISICAVDIIYLLQIIAIPFNLNEIAKNTRRGR